MSFPLEATFLLNLQHSYFSVCYLVNFLIQTDRRQLANSL
jgi:hypothetical protein